MTRLDDASARTALPCDCAKRSDASPDRALTACACGPGCPCGPGCTCGAGCGC